MRTLRKRFYLSTKLEPFVVENSLVDEVEDSTTTDEDDSIVEDTSVADTDSLAVELGIGVHGRVEEIGLSLEDSSEVVAVLDAVTRLLLRVPSVVCSVLLGVD